MLGIKPCSPKFGSIEVVVLRIFIEPVLSDQSGARHLPASCNGTKQLQERDGAGGCRFHIVRESRKEPVCRLGQSCNSFPERVANHDQPGMAYFSEFGIESAHLRQQDTYG